MPVLYQNKLKSLTILKTGLTLLIYWLAIFALPAQQEQFSFDLITSENRTLRKGLSQNTIYSMLQDQKGYLWFGTWDGLNKFDGLKFTTYNKKNNLSNEVINCLLESNDGNIWIGTENGLNFLNRKTGEIKTYFNNPKDTLTLSDNWINCLFQSPTGKIYIGTRKGFNVMDTETEKIRRFQSKDAANRRTKSNNVKHIVRHNSEYWVGTDFGLVRYNPATHENVRYLNRPNDRGSLSNNQINVIFTEDHNHLWIGTENGLNLLDVNTGLFTIFKYNSADSASLSHNSVKAIFQDDKGKIWIGTDGGGINILNENRTGFTRIMSQPSNPKSLNNNRVYSFLQDKTGNIWVGTFKGLHRIDRYNRNFKLYTHNPGDPNTIANNLIWSFCEIEPDVFWIATDNGITIFDRLKNSFSYFNPEPSNPDGLSSNRIRPVIKDIYGNIWIGTRDAGLNKLDPETGKSIHFVPSIQDQHTLADKFVNIIYNDKNGKIWVGTQNGLNCIDPLTNQIKIYQHDPNDRNSLSNNTVFHIMEDKQGTMWLATYNGINRYNQNSDDFTVFYHEIDEPGFLSSNRFFYLFEDSDNNFWVGTRGGGLMLFDRQSGNFVRSYSTDDGLPNNVVYGILEDDAGALWMSTNWGISRFDRKKEIFVNYDVTDGLQSNEFNALALLKSSSGLMFFGGMNGFNMFDPAEIQSNPKQPDILISGFKLFNVAKPGEINHLDTIFLKPGENFFTIEFTALDFTNPYKTQFAYILEDYNDNWTYVDGTRNYAEYTKVNPGIYTFKVIGSNSDGVWNNEGVTITIVLRPFWFQTLFFRIFVIAALIAAIWYSIYRRYRFLERKSRTDNKMLQIQNQLLDIQQNALRLQMNPHFIFNSLNSIQSFILSKDTDQAVNYLSRFSQLMRMIMTNSTQSVIPLSDEILAVKHFLEIEQLRFDQKFSYSIEVAPEIDEEFTGVPPMLIQPFIENAIIHGLLHKESDGKITIIFRKSGNFIHCTITDNGIGRKKAEEIKKQTGLNQQSKGMMITKERLDFFNKNVNDQVSVKITDLTDDKGLPAGTRVELIIAYHEI